MHQRSLESGGEKTAGVPVELTTKVLSKSVHVTLTPLVSFSFYSTITGGWSERWRRLSPGWSTFLKCSNVYVPNLQYNPFFT
jgi:hypothetical protein